MVIISSKAGQLANQLFLFAHFIANAIEYKYKLINPPFDGYCYYFESTSNNKFLNYPIKAKFFRNPKINKIIFKFADLLIRILTKIKFNNLFYEVVDISKSHDLKGMNFDMNDRYFVELVKSKKIIIAKGWLFRDNVNFNKYSPLIREIFMPKAQYYQNVLRLIDSLRKESDLLIGVHIRRGDYKGFENGKYYFQLSTYQDKMVQLQKIFFDKKISFLICSNEKINLDEFKDFKAHLGTTHFIEDMYSLSKCDYIIGPPSTYSMWASFYGQTPLFKITEKDATIVLDNFKVVCL
jgi:hypothetical protein